ncbi:MAG: HAD family phosphatase [Planctomycetes bacterium]|nr:HAD family phosphatase [Planctomycetota bacterium]
MKINEVKAVIFDLDGVLVDTGKYHKQSWYDLSAEQGWAFSDEIFKRTFGMHNAQIIPTLAGGDVSAAELDSLADWKEQRYRDLIAGKLFLLEGVKDLIVDLKDNGYLLAVGTSTPKINLDFMLEHTHIRNRFDVFVTSEDVINGKPAPDTFLKAAKKLNVPPSSCVVVEDAIPGVEAGKAAGMVVLAVTTTRRRGDLIAADRVVDSLAKVSATDFDKLLSLLD